MSKKPSPSTIAVNKKARHLYELSDFVEAGISLTGPEVKSIRAGEAFVLSLHIAPYDNAGYVPQDPDRPRRLLLHAAEIRQMAARVEQKGLTVVPVRMYFKQGKVKMEIALGRGKKLFDHRETLKRRAEERDAARDLA